MRFRVKGNPSGGLYLFSIAENEVFRNIIEMRLSFKLANYRQFQCYRVTAVRIQEEDMGPSGRSQLYDPFLYRHTGSDRVVLVDLNSRCDGLFVGMMSQVTSHKFLTKCQPPFVPHQVLQMCVWFLLSRSLGGVVVNLPTGGTCNFGGVTRSKTL